MTAARTTAGTAYPQRPSHFAHKALRAAVKSCAAMRIGADGLALVTTIALQEDVIRYSKPVDFWNEQLAPLLGMNVKRLDRVRDRCVAAGWLHYEAGAKGRPGIYWVKVPSHAAWAPDTPTCEELGNPTPSKTARDSRSKSTRKAAGKRRTKREESVAQSVQHPALPLTLPLKGCAGSLKTSLGKWARSIPPEEFSSLDAGLRRWAQVAHNHWLADDDGNRLRFLTAWRKVGGRYATGKVSKPGSVFATVLLNGIERDQWEGANGDEDAAREYLRRIDRANHKPLALASDLAARMAVAPLTEEECDAVA
jgi:hypothetical protein